MGERSRAKQMKLPVDAVAGWVDQLSAYIMGNSTELGEEFDSFDWESIKLSLKKSGDSVKAELKIKYPKQRPADEIEEAIAHEAKTEEEETEETDEEENHPEDVDASMDDDEEEAAVERLPVKESISKGNKVRKEKSGDKKKRRESSDTKKKSPKPDGSYKALKKEMKRSSKALKAAASAGELPTQEMLSAFLSQSMEMTRYPDKGEALYPQYRAACTVLQAAYDSENAAAFQAAWEKIDGIRKEAHRQYR